MKKFLGATPWVFWSILVLSGMDFTDLKKYSLSKLFQISRIEDLSFVF